MVMDFVCKKYRYQLGDTSEDKICMKGLLILGTPSRNTEIFLEMVDLPFHSGSYFISTVPFIGSPHSSGISAKILFRIDIDHPATLGRSTWIFTMAYSMSFFGNFIVFPTHLRAYKLESRKSAPEMRTAGFGSHGKRGIMWTAGDAVFVNSIVCADRMRSCIERYISTVKMPSGSKGISRKKIFVYLYGIKGRISEKCFGIEEGMQGEKVLIIKRDMPNDTKSVCDDGEFKDITEVSIDEKLSDLRVGSGMRRHGSIGRFIRIKVFIIPISFCISFQLAYDTVRKLGIVFRDISFDTGGIKNSHIGFCRIDCLTDGFSKVNKSGKDLLKLMAEVLFESGNL